MQKLGSIFSRIPDKPVISKKAVEDDFTDVLSQSVNLCVIVSDSDERRFEKCDPVSPSIASDFSVSINALRSRGNERVISRDSVDPVDMQSKYPDLFNN